MSLAEDIGNIPQIKRGKCWCTTCGRMAEVNGVNCTLGDGWPKCCGYTMTIDSPEERARLDTAKEGQE